MRQLLPAMLDRDDVNLILGRIKFVYDAYRAFVDQLAEADQDRRASLEQRAHLGKCRERVNSAEKVEGDLFRERLENSKGPLCQFYFRRHLTFIPKPFFRFLQRKSIAPGNLFLSLHDQILKFEFIKQGEVFFDLRVAVSRHNNGSGSAALGDNYRLGEFIHVVNDRCGLSLQVRNGDNVLHTL